MEGLLRGNSCDCFIDAEEVQAASQQDYPKSCLDNCRSQFLRRISPDWTDDNTTSWPPGCRNLTTDKAMRSSQFWELYWCDELFCGVAINRTGGLEQDRESPSSPWSEEAQTRSSVLCVS